MARSMSASAMAAICAVAMVMAVQTGASAADKKATTPEQITVTGCLHSQGAKYVLTDVSGQQAPKGRSWKTGYMKHGMKDVEVVSSSTGPKLKDHVGHMVTVMGVKDGETHMKARSIKPMTASCS